MIDKVLKFTDDYSLNNKTVVVAFSGGYDSMCLLDILNNISEIKHIKLIAAHYNHNWRGEEAEREQEHCREFCRKKGIEFYTETAPADVKKTEAVARDLRYDFLKRVFEKYDADAVVTAHNYDDNAETILYRIIKGTGVVGLKGIAPKRDIYYRPLINVRRAEIEEYCRDNGLEPNKDSSNENIKYKRNLIRKEILPLMEKINPEIKKTLTSLGAVAEAELNIADEYISSVADKLFNGEKIVLNYYSGLSPAMKKKIIYHTLYDAGIEYDYTKISNVCDFIEKQIYLNSRGKCSLSNNVWLFVGDNYIELIRASEVVKDEIPIRSDGEYSLNGAVFGITKADVREKTPDEYSAYVDLSGYDNIILRTRRDGDYIYPLGLGGKMKLKKYLNQKKIPQHKRDGLIVLASGNEILWVGGVGVSDKIKVTGKPTNKISIKY
ncbi:MAG: tRNA lysidine(34) synthetase TilS [Cyanobacteria bacterium RUI128]|nr:tRNA lysidine(34) synthetase TilS [Cyanobacteria bacterium RUI128]